VTTPPKPIRLYRHALSGHAHRVELFLSLLGLPYELIDVNMVRAAHKAPDFVAMNNPFGQVPVIEDGDIAIADSNAILVYLATRYDLAARWLPRDAVALARVQQWLSVAAGQLAYGPSSARLAVLFGANLDIERAEAISRQLFDVLDGHLAGRRYLVGDTATIADVAIYSYTAHAPEGGVSLDPYGHVHGSGASKCCRASWRCAARRRLSRSSRRPAISPRIELERTGVCLEETGVNLARPRAVVAIAGTAGGCLLRPFSNV
jgi:glutathione S-transferase